ncbi:hypothetical protein FKW77_010175 [Venturia effusa]|uniref:Uncharacterized protein n=1 Tax=Venturia effusa TaxID=50376 RepID=A0A517L2A3_9PEZI|nr:hypothetical protein FKW77_010175 [Venturia effusa]
MKLFSILAILTSIVSVSAKQWRLCCCHHKHEECDKVITTEIAYDLAALGAMEISNKQWTRDEGAPYDCRNCYAYAHDKKNLDNGLIGGKEFAHFCKRYDMYSTCWNPKPGFDYRNDDDPEVTGNIST